MSSYAEAASLPEGSASSGVHSDLSMYRGSHPPPPGRDRNSELREKIRKEEESITNLKRLLTEYYIDLEYYQYYAIPFDGDYYDDGTHLLDRMEEDCQKKIWRIRSEILSIEDSVGVLKTELRNI